MTSIDNVCDYIIVRLAEAESCSNVLKIQKLLYYCQAWNLAFHNELLFEGNFEAWIHGPVNKDIYNRFRDTKSLYSQVTEEDILRSFNPADISEQDKLRINNVLDVYASFSGTQLEEMTHKEDPWTRARSGYRPSQRCDVPIDENLMKSYYAARLL